MWALARTKTVPALQARTQLGRIMTEVQRGQVRVLVEKSGVPVVAIISAEEFRRVIAEREARFAVVDRIRRQGPRASDAEVQRNVGEALKQVRRRRAQRRPRAGCASTSGSFATSPAARSANKRREKIGHARRRFP